MPYNPPKPLRTHFTINGVMYDEIVYYIIDNVVKDDSDKIIQIDVSFIIGLENYLTGKEFKLVPDSFVKKFPPGVESSAEDFLKYNS